MFVTRCPGTPVAFKVASVPPFGSLSATALIVHVHGAVCVCSGTGTPTCRWPGVDGFSLKSFKLYPRLFHSIDQSMSLDLTLKLSVYAMVLAASVILAFAEGTPSPECASPLIAVVAYVFHEHRRKISLSDFAAGLCGVCGFGLALAELLTGDIEARILSGTHLLVYFTWVVHFMRKRFAQWWWLVALSVLQVAVSSVLTREGWFGASLVGFSMVSVWTLAVFSLYRAHGQFTAVKQDAVGVNETAGSPAWWLSSVPAASRDSSRKDSQVTSQVSRSRGSIQLDSGETWVTRRFTLSTLASFVGMLLAGGIVFSMVPRVGWQQLGTSLGENRDEGVRMSGFTDEVRLGDITNILESSTPVLRMKVMDSTTAQYINPNKFANTLGYAEPLFRGTVHDVYNDGVWSKSNSGGGAKPAKRRLRTREHFIQEYELEPIAGRVLFAVHPINRCELTKPKADAFIHTMRGVLVRNDIATSTSQYRASTDRKTRPTGRPVPFFVQGLSQNARRQYLQLPRRLDDLAESAKDIVGYESNPTQQERIDRLLQYLRAGNFRYSLDLTRTDTTIDPVEDFVFNHRTGHCEYFASAFALMLRAVDVPSRLVTGFKGGDYNEVEKSLTVKQLHAHSWVEILQDFGTTRSWVVYDPTPAEEQTELVEMIAARPPSMWDKATQAASDFWQNYVVNVTLMRQRELFFDPIRDAILDIYENITEFGLIIGVWRLLVDLFTNPERWFSWRGWVSTFITLMLMASVVWILRRLFVRIKQRFIGVDSLPDRSTQIIRFYEHFRDRCSQFGLVPRRGQTAGEFAADVEAALRDVTSDTSVVSVPVNVTQSFYDIRFGRHELTDSELVQLEEGLVALNETLSLQHTSHSSSRDSPEMTAQD